jgi:hypothetical protein
VNKVHDWNSKVVTENQINDLLQALSDLEDTKQRFTDHLAQDIRTGISHNSADPQMGKTAEELKQKIDSMFSQIKNFWPDIDQANPALKDDLYNGLRGKSEYASEIEKGMYCDEHGTNCHSVTAEDSKRWHGCDRSDPSYAKQAK